jgi:glycosyltransferase involved in cell wall biosynthesis
MRTINAAGYVMRRALTGIADVRNSEPPRGVPMRFRSVVSQRIGIALEALDNSTADATAAEAHSRLCSILDGEPERGAAWMVIAVLTAQLPVTSTVDRFSRTTELDGANSAIRELFRHTFASSDGEPSPALLAPVVVVRGVCIDVWLTSKADVATGIQRVVRELAVRWDRDRDVTMLGWTDDLTALRLLTPAERSRALHGASSSDADAESLLSSLVPATIEMPTVVVPWGGVLVEPELVGDPPRALRLMSLGKDSNVELSVIAYDSVPVTSSETANDGVSGSFAKYLSAVKHSTRLAADSHSAAGEFRGFARMLAGQGLPGPDVAGIPLALHVPAPQSDADEEARELFGAFTLPLVLCVGSHEPRKNHLAVLHAAELAWRDGHRFTLAFVGGSGWHSEQFDAAVNRLRAADRPVTTVRALPDHLLWAAYRIARCVVFPSLHEGFGLPVAEAIASGTPVITSNFGSMAEIGKQGGALLVDPRDDHAVSAAIVALLTDDALHALLREQAAKVAPRTWEDYAGEAWSYLVEGIRPANA